MTILAGQIPTADELNAISNYRLLARGRRSTSSTGTTTEVGVLRIDDVPITAGHCIGVRTGALTPDTSVANDVMAVRIRYTTDGSTPTTSSTVLPGSTAQVRQPDANNGESITVATSYTPASNETLSVLLCVARIAGTGTVVLFTDGNFGIDMFVEDLGADPGDTGVDV